MDNLFQGMVVGIQLGTNRRKCLLLNLIKDILEKELVPQGKYNDYKYND